MNYPHASRRRFLHAAGSVGVATGLAGCLSFESAPDGPVLDPPDRHEKRAEVGVPYPIYGEELPGVTVPAPLHDRTVSTRKFVGERHVS